MTGWVAPVLVLVCLLGAAFCCGGIYGLWLAWTQEARMERWAFLVAARARAVEVQRSINETDYRKAGF